MRKFEVFLKLDTGETDTYYVSGRSPVEAAFYAGMKAGMGVSLGSPAAMVVAELLGVDHVKATSVRVAQESLEAVLVEEL